MARDFAKAFYASEAWQKCRAAYLEHVQGLCERCGKPGNIVHHKRHITPTNINDPDITLNFDNLKCVCQDCHAIEHSNDSGPAINAGYIFTAEGDIVKAPPRLIDPYRWAEAPTVGIRKTHGAFFRGEGDT